MDLKEIRQESVGWINVIQDRYRLPDAYEYDKSLYRRPGQTFADQELLPIFTESRGPPLILIFLVVYGKTQEIYSKNNTVILIIRSK
jgi:hypothetical protein